MLFGGIAYDFSDETWEWDGHVWMLKGTVGPGAVHKSSMIYDSHRGVTVLFGGMRNSTVIGETWEWNGSAWTLRSTDGPGPLVQPGLAFDPDRRVAVLFGGRGIEGEFYGNVWEWDGTVWTRRMADSGPSPRTGSLMCYDAGAKRTVVVGGWNQSGNLVDAWAWDGASWMPLRSGPNRSLATLVYDPARRASVLFGGQNSFGGGNFNEVWELRLPCHPPTILTQPIDSSPAAGAPAAFAVQAEPSTSCDTPIAYQWQRRNPLVADSTQADAWIDLVDDGNIVNARTSALLIMRPIPGMATGFRCRLTGGCNCEGQPEEFVYSTTVNFTIACPADFNADGGIDFSDVEAFFERWENGC